MKAVKLTKLVQEMNLKNLTPEVDMEHVRITLPDINRPALQLTGYFEHFASERVQIIGYVEYTYLMHLNPEERKRSFENFVSKQIPCVIFTTMTEPDEDMLDMGRKYNVPILVTEKNHIQFHGRDYPLAECTAGTVYLHSWCTGGCIWCRCADYRRKWYW